MKKELTKSELTLLWDTFRSGSREAFSQLYDLFAGDLYWYGYNPVRNRQVVEDCLHELYLHISAGSRSDGYLVEKRLQYGQRSTDHLTNERLGFVREQKSLSDLYHLGF